MRFILQNPCKYQKEQLTHQAKSKNMENNWYEYKQDFDTTFNL